MSSNYRNYTTWTKPTSTYSSVPSKTSSKFDVAFGRGRTDPKKDEDRSSSSRIATKYTGIRNVSKPGEKKEPNHPPVSYRPLGSRVAPRSREPSPDKSYNYNRLCPKPYSSTRAVSPNTTIPKYTGRASSLAKDEPVSKYRGSSMSKEDLSVPKYSGRSSMNKDSSSSTSQKYITSRFLPKNTIEKSFTAYSRPSTVRTNEVSRKNRELLNVLHAQQETRPNSRCASVTPEPKSSSSVLMVTRSTSPTPDSNPSKPVERFETLPKNQPKKDTVSQTEDSSKSGKAGVRTTAAPWNPFLDMKFSSPEKQPKKTLPPPIPIKNPALHSTTNKDFRKSVLNMNPGKKVGRRSNSASSAESDHSEATDVSESLSSYPSSKLPQRIRRSPSSDTSTTSDEKESKAKNEQEAKTFLMRALAPVTNLFKANKYPEEKVNWMDPSEGPNVTAKQFTRADSGEKAWWLDDTTASESLPKDSESGTKFTEPQNQIGNSLENPPSTTNKSSDVPWWMDKNAPVPEGIQTYETASVPSQKPNGTAHNSSEVPWWLDKNAQVPEGVQKWDTSPSGSKGPPPNNTENSNYSRDVPSWLERNNSGVVEPRNSPSMKNVESSKKSSEVPWWLDKNAAVPEGVQVWKTSQSNSAADTSKDVTWWFDRDSSGPKEKERNEGNNQDDGISFQQPHKLRHIDSGERAWWLSSSEDIPHMEQSNVPLGDRRSPDGLETKEEERLSPYDNVPRQKRNSQSQAFISKHRNIDEILGGGHIWMDRFLEKEGVEVDVGQVRIHDSTPQRGVIEPNRIDSIGGFPKKFSPYSRLDDAALQLYKDGDYGSYLDLEASISEQQEEFEGFQSNKKNSIVLRTQLSVRVHTIIEKLLTSEGRELRRALFSLKQIFQEDKDLVHEFVQNDGLSCLIKVGSEADQNYQNYILRALGQVMLYVDGMNGVMEHNPTIQWLYSLISSKFRLVVKTALKLLLVFVEYTESNCLLLVKAIHTVDTAMGELPWYNIMKLLKDFDSADTELLIYASTLINKVLNGIPDQDSYYDQTDALEEQDFEKIIQRYMSKPGTDLDLLQQFQIYEAVLQYEDGEESRSAPRLLDESVRQTLRTRKSLADSGERRKSRRHSTGTAPQSRGEDSSSSQSDKSQINGCYKDKANDAGVTPALRRRRERAERQRSFMKEQQETVMLRQNNMQNELNEGYPLQQLFTNRKDLTPLLNAVNKLDGGEQRIIHDLEDSEVLLKRENTVKDLTQKLANQNILHSPSEESKMRIGDMSGLISKAKEGLAKSKSRAELARSPTQESALKPDKKSESELKWEELVAGLNRSLNLCDMDFTDLTSDDEADVLAPVAMSNGIPPPPPPLHFGAPPPPPGRIPPPVPPPNFRLSKPPETKIPVKKNKKTVKLFWKEVREDPICAVKLKTGYIWDELKPVSVDTQKLEHLFESRAKDLISKKQQEMNKNKEIIVLDPKRSNAINIGMTKLPPPRSIKTAILKMDATIMNREGIEKLLTMLPTEEERTKIQEAQAANPDLPLGSAEQFLLTLASISELPARLKLWAFKLDFENSEREIAEPLMDLKQGFEVLKVNKTFRAILSTLLSIGNFLNGNEVKGFQIEYLAKVPEVKDTVHKHSLLHHLCHIVMEKFPEASDLYSEIGAITRASKVDFDELSLNVQRLESDCKASWDHLKVIAKHDGSTMMKVKMSDFLADCAERIIILGIIHRRIMNRFHKFLLWLGIPLHQVSDTKPNEFCRIVSEFALEYRTTRERVLQQLEKKANHRERNKTRGKMITDIGKFRSKEDRADAELRQLLGSDISDVESMQGTLPWRRNRTRDSNRSFLGQANGNLTDADDEIIESLVKTATKGPVRTGPRERKRTRHADRKSLKRSRTRENNPFGSRDSP